MITDSIPASIVATLAALILAWGAGCISDAEPRAGKDNHSLRLLEPSEGLIEFRGRIYPERFKKVRGEPAGHHAIVWEEGRAARRALIETDVPDAVVAETLAKLGVAAGNNLEPEAWEERKDATNPSADGRVQGASIEIEVTWLGEAEWTSLATIQGLEDADYRFGDHRSHIPVWRSGCVVCNVSCPGGKISNHTLTIRDQAKGMLSDRIRLEPLPEDGTPVRIRVKRMAQRTPENSLSR